MTTAPLDLISADNSALVLIDYQPAMFRGVGSGDRASIFNAAVAAVQAAAIVNVPVVLSSIYTQGNGEFIASITDLVPGAKVHERTIPGFDALEDDAVAAAVRATGRTKLVISGLWTSMCFAYTALHALRDGHEVYGLIDAGGDATADAHRYGVERMIQAGIVPTTWMPTVSEWMHDWANPKAGELREKVYGAYDPMIVM